jgi:hypothetical protein
MIVVAASVLWQSLAACVGAQSPEPRTPEIEVELASGRLLRATVDARTEPSTLWLRFSRSAIGELTILRPVAWDQISRTRHAGRDYSAAEFRPVADELKQKAPRAVFQPTAAAETVPAAIAANYVADWHPPKLAIVPLVVARLEADAFVANWDGDVEVDGIELHLFPLTSDGMVTAVSATAEARLIARRANPAEPSEPFPQIARWTERILPEQLGPGGVVLRLPFQAIHPDFDFRVGPQGLLHVKLIAPGHGVFETSVADVRIRPYSGMRDRLQHEHNRRFFNGERTGREN